MKMSYFSFYLNSLVNFLKAQVISGGLEISDLELRFAYFDGRRWQMVGLKLPAGVVSGGKILDNEQLVQVLKRLKLEVFRGKSKKNKVPVVLSLSSLGVYTQAFSLPMLKGATLEEAIELNVKMASPMDQAMVYSGYQVIGEDKEKGKVDILAAFIAKDIVDGFQKALTEAGFLVIAVESRSMSLVRLMRQQGIGISRHDSYAVMVLDNENLDFVILRGGQFYFEYISSWSELKGGGREISLTDFRSTITRNLRQVINYYSQHWPEKIQEVILVAVGLQDEVKKIVADNFSLEVKDLQLRFDQPISAEWFFALGGGLRATMSRGGDEDLSLLGLSARDEYRQERIESFFGFWRVAIPVFLSLLLVFFLSGFVFLREMDKSLTKEVGGGEGDARITELNELRAQAEEFNRDIAMIASIRKVDRAKLPPLEKLNSLVSKNSLTFTRFAFRDFNVSLIFYGEARSRDNVISFIEDVKKDKQFSDVRFSLTDIKETAQGFSFSIIFSIAASNTE